MTKTTPAILPVGGLSAKELIVRAAAESLLENGYAGTSVRSIASRAGVAIGNLQYYFPTKSELLIEAWRHLTERSVEELRTSLNQMTDPIWLIESIQLAAFDLLVQAPKQESLQAFLPELFARYRDVVEEQLDRLERDGRVRLKIEREVIVPLILNTVLGFGLYYVVTRDEESCLLALSAWRELASSVVEPVP